MKPKQPFTLYRHQFEAYQALMDKQHHTIVYAGGIGGGKSQLLAFWLLDMCQRYPGTRYLLGRARLTDLKISTVKTLMEVAENIGVFDNLDYNQQKNIIYFRQTDQEGKELPTSEIILKALEMKPSDPEVISLGSIELTGAVIDEAGQIEHKIFTTLHERLRYTKGYDILPKVLIASNPTQNWLYHQFYLPWERGELDPEVFFIQSGPRDNPFLDQAYLKKITDPKNTTEWNYQTRILMNWHFSEGDVELFFPADINDAFARSRGEVNGKQGYITADIAGLGKDKTVVCVWEGWSVVTIEYLSSNNSQEAAKLIMDLAQEYQIPTRHICIDANGYGSGAADMIRGCYRFLAHRRPLRKEGYGSLKDQCFYQLSKKFRKGEIALGCHELQDSVQKELCAHKRYALAKDAPARVTPKPLVQAAIGRSPDLADVLSMRVVFDYQGAAPKLELI